MNNPVGGQTKDAKEEVTETEVKDEEKYWILHHGKLLSKLPLDPISKAAKIDECGDSDDVTNSSSNPNNTNDGKHEIPSVLHCLWLTADISPVGNKPGPGTVGVRNARIWIKPSTEFFFPFHGLCLVWCPVSY